MFKYVSEIQSYMKNDTDISSHLDTIYIKSLLMNPKNIVELGVRGGESSKMFNYVNKEIGSHIVGIDLDKCEYSFMTNGTFYQADDVAFAQIYNEKYGNNIDILFIDTSHLYEHTCAEIKHWFPLLSNKALVIFHDTNLRQFYKRKNGSICQGWDNQRGVIRAIEQYFNINVDETLNITLDVLKGTDSWKLIHEPLCNGLTLCYKN